MCGGEIQLFSEKNIFKIVSVSFSCPAVFSFFFFLPCYSFLWFIFNPHLPLEQQIDLVNLQVHRPWDQLTWVLPLLKPSDTTDKWYSVMRRICQAYSVLFMKIEHSPRKHTQIPETPSKRLHLKWKSVKPLSLLSL